MTEITVTGTEARRWSRGGLAYIYACPHCATTATVRPITDHLIDRHAVPVGEAEAALRRARRHYQKEPR